MIDRPRAWLLTWSALCLTLLAVLTLLVAAEWTPLWEFDREITRDAASWAGQHDTLVDVLRVIEVAGDTVSALIISTVVVLLLWLKGHRRGATYAAIVLLASWGLTQAMKRGFAIARPEDSVLPEQLTSGSFPSGHAAWIVSLATVLFALSQMLVRRSNLRRAIGTGLLLLCLVVFADRILLGRHFPSDVVGGALLSLVLALAVLAFYSPQPRSLAETSASMVASVPASSRDLHVVLNPIKVEDVGQFKSIVSSMAAEAGWNEPVWHLTTVEDPGTGMAHAAAVAGADLVIVCGGDGTVREVCAEVAGTGIPVGIIPAGTGNLLARNLDLPLYIRSAIDVALNGQDRAIDMVKVSGDGGLEDTHFLVMAGMGFDAAIMEGVNEDIKARVGWLAYVISGLKSLMFPAVRVEISVDDGPFTKHRARTVLVGNVGFLQAGMPLLPDATIDDGVLDVVLLHPKRFLSWLPIVWRVLAKRHKTDETLDRMTGRKIVVRASTDTPRQLDGDSIGLGRELAMECVHGRLLVRVAP